MSLVGATLKEFFADERLDLLSGMKVGACFGRRYQGQLRFLGFDRPRCDLARIYLHEQRVEVAARDPGKESVLLADPDLAELARFLARSGRGAWPITYRDWTPRGGYFNKVWLTAGELDALTVERVEVAPGCVVSRGERPALARYRYRSALHYSELTWYHATRKSHVSKIRRMALLPAHQARERTEARSWFVGWTSINFDLQDAVYLTADRGYAESIARTLAAIHGEPAVILSVPGSQLRSEALGVDEDALRDSYTGEVSSDACLQGIPAYFTSLLFAGGRLAAVAYYDQIPFDVLTVEEQIEHDSEE